MTTVLESNKAKTARRVIEVLEFFDEHHREATVMDIVRRYNRPQSSTSELLASLVEMGLLYKDTASRSYTLTPRAAILGSLSQPTPLRDGSLNMMIDRLIAQTGLGTALLGMVGLNSQIFRWSPGSRYVPAKPGRLCNGAQASLADSVAGQLLLSTIRAGRRDGVIRRLNAEAPDDRKFNPVELSQRVQEFGSQGYAVGPAGFGGTAEMAAIMLPGESDEQPMVLAFTFEPSAEIDPQALVELLQRSALRCIAPSLQEGTGEPVVAGAWTVLKEAV